MPLQPTSRRAAIVRPSLNRPWLPKEDAADRRSRQEGPEDNQLNAEEQKGDEDEDRGEYSDNQQPSFLKVDVAEPVAEPG